MSTIGIRLREERERMGLSQTDFAKLAGHSRGGQASYERGDHVPGGVYLSALAAAGVDVLYVLTGNRSTSSTESVSMEEQKLIENYRAMSEAARLNVQAVSDTLAQSTGKLKTGSD